LVRLAESLIGFVEFAPEGVLVLTRDVLSEEAIIISLVGSYVGYRLGRIEDEADSASGLAKSTGKALKTISNQLSWMVDDGLVERIERGKYRISSFGIKRFLRMTEKLRLREGITSE
jgi:predicted transcriptional regulator